MRAHPLLCKDRGPIIDIVGCPLPGHDDGHWRRDPSPSSALQMSILVSVKMSAALFLTLGERRAAQMAGCCPRNAPTVCEALFNATATSVFNL